MTIQVDLQAYVLIWRAAMSWTTTDTGKRNPNLTRVNEALQLNNPKLGSWEINPARKEEKYNE